MPIRRFRLGGPGPSSRPIRLVPRGHGRIPGGHAHDLRCRRTLRRQAPPRSTWRTCGSPWTTVRWCCWSTSPSSECGRSSTSSPSATQRSALAGSVGPSRQSASDRTRLSRLARAQIHQPHFAGISEHADREGGSTVPGGSEDHIQGPAARAPNTQRNRSSEAHLRLREEQLKLGDVGAVLGLSESRVRQAHRQGITRSWVPARDWLKPES